MNAQNTFHHNVAVVRCRLQTSNSKRLLLCFNSILCLSDIIITATMIKQPVSMRGLGVRTNAVEDTITTSSSVCFTMIDQFGSLEAGTRHDRGGVLIHLRLKFGREKKSLAPYVSE